VISDYALEFNGKVLHFGTLLYQSLVEQTSLVSDRIGYFSDLKTENLKLKLEIAELKNAMEVSAVLQAENQNLREILKVTDNAEYEYKTGRILGVSVNPFSSNAIVQAGRLDGVEVDDVVIGADGLVGRVTSVGSNYSSIMLITDHNSRIPVITGSSREKGILAKHGDHLKLIYLPENHQVTVGEAIYTSGDGKIYPHGLLVGRVDRLNNDELIVHTSVNFRKLEFVMIQLRANLKDSNI
jgi:rod shape-determining protein MreC